MRSVVGLSACRREISPHTYHVIQDKYVAAVRDVAGALPVVIPADGAASDPESLIEVVDGLVLTGSYSNIEPSRYGVTTALDATRDPERDETTMRLIRTAIAAGCPVLGICRGLQEINVAFGGTLHEELHAVVGKLDHRQDESQPLERQYGPTHDIELARDGELVRIVGTHRVRVNSLHAQGVDCVGDGLIVEARAPDGVVEALRVAGAPAFAIAVQWHPEYRAGENPASKALFGAFGDACRARATATRA
jgi:putative glutamine amidotransferase